MCRVRPRDRNGWRALAFLCALLPTVTMAAPITREQEVPRYVLPPLQAATVSETAEAARRWAAERTTVIAAFTRDVYGPSPRLGAPTVTIRASGPRGDGLGRRTHAELSWTSEHGDHSLQAVLYQPANRMSAPCFVALNFHGNHTLEGDARIPVEAAPGTDEPRPRGALARRWPLEMILAQGCALVTAWRDAVVPDNPEHYREGVLRLVGDDAHAVGAISVWAWALTQLRTWAAAQPGIDRERMIALGHSRLGKAALWAAATDPAFAAAISNNSGCMGAALSRREFGETVAVIRRNFPYWFTPAFARGEALPSVDQHQLLALMAPRPLYVASASEDLWADPHGEFLAAQEAAKLFAAITGEAATLSAMPAPGEAAGGHVRYHLRPGKHDLTSWDWERYLAWTHAALR